MPGELKGMKIGSQDVTKQYTDLESRLRAARTMEQRLLQDDQGRQGRDQATAGCREESSAIGGPRSRKSKANCGTMRTSAALATLTISLTEKEIRAAAAVTENERVQAGVEVEDVDKAYQQTLAVVAEVKGRVTKSEVKQLSAGQFNAAMQFEVPPDATGPMRDRLRQLGRVARLEIDRVQKAEGGTRPGGRQGEARRNAVSRADFTTSRTSPRGRRWYCRWPLPDVRAAFQTVRDAAGKAKGRVRIAQFNEQDAQNVTAQFDVEVRRPDEGALRTALDAAGEVVARQVTRAPESDNVTDSKVLYRVTLMAASRIHPRDSTSMTLEVPDVDQRVGRCGRSGGRSRRAGR